MSIIIIPRVVDVKAANTSYSTITGIAIASYFTLFPLFVLIQYNLITENMKLIFPIQPFL